jgi:hypothetical protein
MSRLTRKVISVPANSAADNSSRGTVTVVERFRFLHRAILSDGSRNLTTPLRSRFVEHSPEGYVVMQDATQSLGVTRQTVLQRVKRGELDAVLVCSGRRKGLCIKAVSDQTDLFEHSS